MKVALVGGEDVSKRIPIAREFKAKGIEVTIIGSESDDIFREAQIDYISFPLNRSFNLYSDWKSFRALTNIFKSKDFDIVHSFDTKLTILVPLVLKNFESIKSVRTITGMGKIFVGRSFVNRFLIFMYNFIQIRLKYSIDATVFQNTDDMSYYMNHNLVYPNKLSVLIKSSGLDLSHYSIIDSQSDLKSSLSLNAGPIFILVSRLIYQKGVIEFVNAARICREKGFDFNCLLVGPVASEDDGIDISILEQNKDVVQYLGKRSDIRELLQIADVFVFPSYYREGVPRVLLEASAMGLGIITTDMPGCNDVVKDNWNGLIVPIKNDEELAKSMIDIVSDREKLLLFGDRSKKHVLGFSLEKVASDYFALYKSII